MILASTPSTTACHAARPPMEAGSILVTGAGSGIGRATCIDLASQGVSVLINDVSEDDCDSVAAEIRAAGHLAETIPGDITDPSTIERVAELVRGQSRPLIGMVLAAGVFRGGRSLDAKVADFEAMFQVNVMGVWLPVRGLAELLAPGASIVVVASIAGLRVHPMETLYGVTKSAALALAKGLAGELAHRGIRVNALCPGPIGDEGMQQRLFDEAENGAEERARLERRIPLKRLASVDDVVRAGRFLLGAESGYITGTTVSVDGGLVMH